MVPQFKYNTFGFIFIHSVPWVTRTAVFRIKRCEFAAAQISQVLHFFFQKTKRKRYGGTIKKSNPTMYLSLIEGRYVYLPRDVNTFRFEEWAASCRVVLKNCDLCLKLTVDIFIVDVYGIRQQLNIRWAVSMPPMRTIKTYLTRWVPCMSPMPYAAHWSNYVDFSLCSS